MNRGGVFIRVQLRLEAFQPFVAQIRTGEIPQWIVGILGTSRNQRRQRGNQCAGNQGLVQVQVCLAFEAAMPRIFLFRGLGGDERYPQIRQLGILSNG